MTTPEYKEPRLLESDGYLARALRRLGAGLGPFVFEKTKNEGLKISDENSTITRDLSVIFGIMEKKENWNRLGLSLDEWNRLGLLIGFRNGPWAHFGPKGYDDDDVLDTLSHILRLLGAVSATEQAQEVGQMWDGLNKLIAELKSGSDKPMRQQPDSEVAKLLNQMADLWNVPELLRQMNDLRNQVAVQQQMYNLQSDVSQLNDQLKEVLHHADFPIAQNTADTENALPVSFLAAPEQGDNVIHAHFAIGVDPRRQEEYQQAINTYTDIISRDPSNTEAYLRRGCAHANLRQARQFALQDEVFAEEAEHINDILAGGSGTIKPVKNIGKRFSGLILQASEDPIQIDLDEAIRLNPNLADAYYLRAYFYLEGIISDPADYHGVFNKAIGDLDKAIQLNPNHVEAYYRRGQGHLQIGEPARAIADFNIAIDLASEDTDIQSIYQSRASAYRKRGYEQAIEDFTAAIAHEQEVGFHYRQRGIAYADEGEYDLAIDDFTAAIGLISEPADVYYERGEIYVKKGELDRAIADFSTAIELKPRNFRAYDSRIDIYFQQEKYDLAIADLDKSIQISPLWAANYCLQRGVAYGIKEEYDLAIADFEKVIAIGDTIYVPLQVTQSAREYMELVTRYRDAVTEYDQAVEDNPSDPEVWHLRGLHYLDDMGDRPDYDRAVADFSEGIKLAPESAEVWYDRGRAYYRLGDYEAAYVDYSRAIDLKPNDYIAWCERGKVHQRRGEHRNAIADFDQSLTLNPDFALAYQLRHESHARLGNREQAQADFEMWRGLA